MTKTIKIILIVLVIVILVLVGLLASGNVFSSKSSYWAVYLRTGDLYFGKLIRFPYFGLKQVYLFQANPNDAQNPISVQKFTNVFWGPSDYLKINRSEVVWMTKLNPASQLLQFIKTNPNLTMPPAAQNQLLPTPGGVAPNQ